MFLIIFLILLCLAIIGLILHFIFISYLKANHYEIWEMLGKPSFPNNSIKNNINIKRFLSKKEYLKVNDSILNLLATANCYFGRVYLGIFIFSCILIVLYIVYVR